MKIKSDEIQAAISTLKTNKEEKGIIPATNKKIIIRSGVSNFKGKSLKIDKGLFKNGRNHFYKAGTKWEDVDAFGKKNIVFSESDFN